MQDTPEVIAELEVSVLRRIIGIGVMLGLAGVLFYVVAFNPPVGYLQVLFVVSGFAVLWGARALARSTAGAVILTQTDLRDRDGTQIARLDRIEEVDGGFFAFRPSNGFTIRLTHPEATKWRPGLWWRAGRRIGIGGMTGRQSGKFMAQMVKDQMAVLQDPENP